jgi:hypothetical protein
MSVTSAERQKAYRLRQKTTGVGVEYVYAPDLGVSAFVEPSERRPRQIDGPALLAKIDALWTARRIDSSARIALRELIITP